jgi:hypothetical protein
MAPMSSALKAACFVALVTQCVSCGGSSPTSASNSPTNGSNTTSGTSTATYLGNITIGDKTGTVLARAASTLSSLAPRWPVLARLLSVMEVPVYADSASGLLSLSDGTVVTLSGTFSGGTFSLSGGGYAMTLATSGASLSGSGTAPSGATVVVSPPDQVATPTPVPANAAGTYTGSFRIEAPSYDINTFVSDGSIAVNCTYTTVVTGTLTLTLNARGDSYHAVLSAMWTDTQTVGSCPSHAAGTVSVPGPEGSSYDGPPSNIETAFVSQGPVNGGAMTRVGTFVGAVSGNTIVGRYARSEAYSINLGTQIHKEGYAAAAGNVVLTKQ